MYGLHALRPHGDYVVMVGSSAGTHSIIASAVAMQLQLIEPDLHNQQALMMPIVDIDIYPTVLDHSGWCVDHAYLLAPAVHAMHLDALEEVMRVHVPPRL